MPNNKSRKTAPERAAELVRAWRLGKTPAQLASPESMADLKQRIQHAIANADKATLARDDVRDGKPQRRAFTASGGKLPR